ncbi:MAG: YgiT-type zinc finger protein [Anaerolineales bacterium]|nr:YgiT-type zinc finger protein [Anaerolineales bacterium]
MNHEAPVPPLQESQHTPCSHCGAGVMHLRHITYFTWLGGELITVPDFPAWICDVCGRREYDERAITWLTMLLNPEAGHAARRVKRTPRPAPPKGTHPSPPLE